MKELDLINTDKKAIVDEEDFEKILSVSKFWSLSPEGYVRTRSHLGITWNKKSTHIVLHRFLMKFPEKGIFVDHINRNKLDNRKQNLRLVNTSQNTINCVKFKGLTSKYKGVCLDKNTGLYVSRICVNGHRKYGGQFTKEVDAAKKSNELYKKFHGEYAVLNEI